MAAGLHRACGEGVFALKALLFSVSFLAAVPLAADEPAAFVWRQVENKAFGVGESLSYVIKYGFVGAGRASMSVVSTETVNGRVAYRIESAARTSKTMDVVYKVRDNNVSWMDVESLCALRFDQALREGGYRKETRTIYDHVRGKFTFWKKRKGKETTQEGDMAPFVQDVLSGLYYIRTRDLEVGKEYKVEANTGGKNWPLVVFVRERETVKVGAGKFDCFHLEPVLAGEGIFKQEGKLEVWMTADERKMPVLLRSRVMVGAFDAELESYSTQPVPLTDTAEEP